MRNLNNGIRILEMLLRKCGRAILGTKNRTSPWHFSRHFTINFDDAASLQYISMVQFLQLKQNCPFRSFFQSSEILLILFYDFNVYFSCTKFASQNNSVSYFRRKTTQV